jgi:hypothetical protein
MFHPIAPLTTRFQSMHGPPRRVVMVVVVVMCDRGRGRV